MPFRFRPTCAANTRPRNTDGPIENRCRTIAAPAAALSGAPKKAVAPKWNATWNPPTAPGVGTATPRTSSARSKNDPVNGTSNRKATATDQMPRQMDNHSGNDQASASNSRLGCRIAPSPRANFSATLEIRAASADGTTFARRSMVVPSRAGSFANTNNTTSATIENAAAEAPAHFTALNPVGFVNATFRPNRNTYDASNMRTVMVSSSRSRMIVAKAPDAPIGP